MAARIAAGEAEARQWYRSEPIAGLGGRTALELVRSGRGPAVLDFLLGVLRDEMQAASGTSGGHEWRD
ncbi:antitoxin Xre/MbcA/ParS toxin-binding domain-containing protein [Stenotrophomonas sp. NLF4-10]|uniref:antitoxin Xre/MbcA/ParS toxin-binding domain-containing protein n=1 Tax=Stenotrophomonas sp. NLF4-10 TaxID=2918754 RepID=UPI001EFB4D4C|nr:antitoxin Xre/MbcA/ParS toxin-binding domain-containing protein [Stenotrophomonas sp. NLF4-10]MCG8277474.1 MbcA/ParS/Xre antitoxin family protein [Stenotrophomonas sp. NLF4-10]